MLHYQSYTHVVHLFSPEIEGAPYESIKQIEVLVLHVKMHRKFKALNILHGGSSIIRSVLFHDRSVLTHLTCS